MLFMIDSCHAFYNSGMRSNKVAAKVLPAVIINAAIRFPRRIAKKLRLIFIPNRDAAILPVQTPVVGSGTATKIISP